MTRRLFGRFTRQARGLELAGFALAKRIAVPASAAELGHADVAALRALHAEAMHRHRAGVPDATPPIATLLDAKRELARRLLAPCRLCALACGVDRTAGPAGACGLGPGVARYLDFVHEGEEPEVSPTHAVLLAGCNYRCAYCSDWPHVDRPEEDASTSSEELARSIDRRRAVGAASLSWIGGEPGVNLPGILDALARATASVPVVWNSNGHSTEEVRDLLEGVVDAYVLDLKHGNDACALEVARAPRYLETVLPAIERASREAFTIVRHLLLPGHLACCTLPVLRLLAAMPVRVNLMAQYRANGNVRGTALDARVSREEGLLARAEARRLGLATEPLGRLAPPLRGGGGGELPFESAIYVDPDGSVTLENLSPELREVARELGLDGDWHAAPPQV